MAKSLLLCFPLRAFIVENLNIKVQEEKRNPYLFYSPEVGTTCDILLFKSASSACVYLCVWNKNRGSGHAPPLVTPVMFGRVPCPPLPLKGCLFPTAFLGCPALPAKCNLKPMPHPPGCACSAARGGTCTAAVTGDRSHCGDSTGSLSESPGDSQAAPLMGSLESDP